MKEDRLYIRISKEDKDTMQKAAIAARMTLSQWALSVLVSFVELNETRPIPKEWSIKREERDCE